MTAVFEGIPRGTYAVSVLHDENGNGRLDSNVFRIPTEGYGASRDARGTLGPPSFDDAKVPVVEEAVTVEVPVHYP